MLLGFDYRLETGDRLSVYPVFESLDIGPVTRLRPLPLREPKFVCDVHLGKLARRLRLLGFDVVYGNMATDPELVETALAEQRIILTRDRGILKLTVVPLDEPHRKICMPSSDFTIGHIDRLHRFRPVGHGLE